MVFGENVVNIVIRAQDKFSGTFNKVKASMKSFRGAALGMAAVGGVIALGLKSAVTTSIELETAMVGVRKTTGLTATEIDKLRKEFIDLSKVMPVSATDLAKIGEVAGQLGIVGTENIKSFTTVVAKMSIATELTAEAAALSLAKISNAMGLPISEAEKLGSAINELSNISAASSTEIIDALVRVAGSAKTLGLSTDVVAGLTAALVASGEPAQRAGTKLRSAFDSVVKKMNDEVIPLMGEDFPDALRKDANGAILSLIKQVSKIKDPIARQQKAMDIFGTVGASAINKLSNNLPEMNRLIEASSEQFANATSLEEEYNIALESTANQIQLTKNAFTAMQLEISEVLLPALLPLINGIRTVIEWFSGLPGPVKEVIVIFTAVTAAILLIAGAIALVTLIATPWLALFLALAAVITFIIIIIKNWELVVLALKNTFISFGNIVLSVWNGIVNAIEASINFVIDMINWLIRAMNKIPGVSIPLIPELNVSGIKADLMKFDFGEPGQFSGRETTPTTQINIDNVNGADPDAVAQSLQDLLENKISI